MNSQNIKNNHYKCIKSSFNLSSMPSKTVTSILSFSLNHQDVITDPDSYSMSCVM